MAINILKPFHFIFLFASVLLLAYCTEAPQQGSQQPTAAKETTASNDITLKQKRDLGLTLEVYKDPNCGCCAEWITHAEDHGFTANAHDTSDMVALKKSHNVPGTHHSCHTAVSEEGFVFEGHVPAKFIEQFLAEKPEGAFGLTVPAMPIGSPGMEMGKRFNPYKIFLLNAEGEPTVYAEVNTYDEQF